LFIVLGEGGGHGGVLVEVLAGMLWPFWSELAQPVTTSVAKAISMTVIFIFDPVSD
jgi:hypothetical protein